MNLTWSRAEVRLREIVELTKEKTVRGFGFLGVSMANEGRKTHLFGCDLPNEHCFCNLVTVKGSSSRFLLSGVGRMP